VHEWTEAIVSGVNYSPSRCAHLLVSCDGMVCVWDPSDGRCLVSNSHLLPYAPSVLSSLPNRRHVAVSGQTMAIDIVDSWTLKIIRTLRGHGDWVTGLYAFDVGSRESM